MCDAPGELARGTLWEQLCKHAAREDGGSEAEHLFGPRKVPASLLGTADKNKGPWEAVVGKGPKSCWCSERRVL